ncbi:MAG: hypothetical protein E7166_01560 [Firmicutes bacterium]|nr:hypothetical protein [Bacillota bacterium]
MKRIIVLNFIKHKDVVYGINRFNKKYVDLKSDKKSTLEGITEIVNNNQNLYMKRKENEFYISFKDFEIFINIDNNDKYYEKFNNLYTSHKAMQKNNGIKNIKFTKKAISISVAASLITAGIGYAAYKILPNIGDILDDMYNNFSAEDTINMEKPKSLVKSKND